MSDSECVAALAAGLVLHDGIYKETDGQDFKIARMDQQTPYPAIMWQYNRFTGAVRVCWWSGAKGVLCDG